MDCAIEIGASIMATAVTIRHSRRITVLLERALQPITRPAPCTSPDDAGGDKIQKGGR